MPDIHHLAAAPWEPDLFVAGEWERTAHVWSLTTSAAVASLDTVFDSGGCRLALVPGKTPVVVAGAWQRHGVCGYSLTGDLLWQDRSRSNVQSVTALASGRVAVGHARGPARVLDAVTGDELRSLRGVREVLALKPDTSLLVSGSSVQLADADLEPTSSRIQLPPSTPMVSAAAAGTDRVAIAGMEGCVWIVDPAGVRTAEFLVPGGHAPFLGHNPTTGHWQVVTRVDRQDDVQFELISLADHAEVVARRPLPWVDDALWLGGGSVMVYENEDGVFVLDDSDPSARRLVAPA